MLSNGGAKSIKSAFSSHVRHHAARREVCESSLYRHQLVQPTCPAGPRCPLAHRARAKRLHSHRFLTPDAVRAVTPTIPRCVLCRTSESPPPAFRYTTSQGSASTTRTEEMQLPAERTSARPATMCPNMQEDGPSPGHPPPNPSPPLPLPHHCAELAPPSSQAHHHRATHANLLRSGGLVDEPGSGARPRRTYQSLHHGGPAGMLKCPVFVVPHPTSLASWA